MFLAVAFSARADNGDSNNNSNDWPVAGQNLRNTRSQPGEQRIGPENVKTLGLNWTFTAGGDVSATPTVHDGVVYFPDWRGNLFAVEAESGRLVWSHQISEYNGFYRSFSRTSPAVSGDDIVIGDILDHEKQHDGANVMAINRHSGRLHWITQVDKHPAAIITGSPVVADGVVYVGVSSIEESLATDPAYPCCTFRGSMVALDAQTGRMLWQTYTVPDNHRLTGGYSGNAIWQPPAIDLRRGTLFVGTGNNYTAPPEVEDCINHTMGSAQTRCAAPDDYFDAALALDLHTGRIKWAKVLWGYDVWTVACLTNTNPVACPVPTSPDYDIGGSGPNLFPNLVGYGQKSGIYWALDPDTGRIVWSAVVGPGGVGGGVEWGTATDGRRIYVAISNSLSKPYPLINGQRINWGAWSALDVATGKILWQTAVPDHTQALGAVSTADGVVYAPSFGGLMNALDARTGAVLWSFDSGGTVVDGPSISDGRVFWASGYSQPKGGIGNNRVYAFGLAGQASNNNGGNRRN